MVAGPTNLAALLNSFQMGFRALALQKRSGEVWQLLAAIKKEFENYGEVVDKLGRQLTTAGNSVENLGKRARIMSRKLKTVEVLPDQTTAEQLLGLEGDGAEAPDEIVKPPESEIAIPGA
jgi:DNA recombination protein RmuC